MQFNKNRGIKRRVWEQILGPLWCRAPKSKPSSFYIPIEWNRAILAFLGVGNTLLTHNSETNPGNQMKEVVRVDHFGGLGIKFWQKWLKYLWFYKKKKKTEKIKEKFFFHFFRITPKILAILKRNWSQIREKLSGKTHESQTLIMW